jgi:hypothetical protein
MIGKKCVSCNDLYPKANSRKEIKNPRRPLAETMTYETVKRLIYEVLEEANIKRHECEKCKKLFFRSSPAQKYCSACKKETK